MKWVKEEYFAKGLAAKLRELLLGFGMFIPHPGGDNKRLIAVE